MRFFGFGYERNQKKGRVYGLERGSEIERSLGSFWQRETTVHGGGQSKGLHSFESARPREDERSFRERARREFQPWSFGEIFRSGGRGLWMFVVVFWDLCRLVVMGLWRSPDGCVDLLQTKRGGEKHTKRREEDRVTIKEREK